MPSRLSIAWAAAMSAMVRRMILFCLLIVFLAYSFVAVVVIAMVVSLPQLMALWAVASPESLPRRLILPLGVLTFTSILPGRIDLTIVIGLEMLKVALVLWLVKGAHDRTLRFTLGQIMVATAACAVLLAVLSQTPVRYAWPSLETLAAGSTISAVTLVSIWAVLSPRSIWQRTGVVILLVSGCVLSIGECFPQERHWDPMFIATAALTVHALIVMRAAQLWAKAVAAGEWCLPSDP